LRDVYCHVDCLAPRTEHDMICAAVEHGYARGDIVQERF